MNADMTRSVLSELERVCTEYTTDDPLYISLEESPQRQATKKDMGCVRQYVETILQDQNWLNVSCRVNRLRVEVKSATKSAETMSMTAAGIARDGQAFVCPPFAHKLGATVADMDAELSCLLR